MQETPEEYEAEVRQGLWPLAFFADVVGVLSTFIALVAVIANRGHELFRGLNLAGLMLLLVGNRARSSKKGRLSVHEGALWLDGTVVVRQRNIRRLRMSRRPNDLLVCEKGIRGVKPTVLRFASRENAFAIARALQHDPTQSVAEYTVYEGTKLQRGIKEAALWIVGAAWSITALKLAIMLAREPFDLFPLIFALTPFLLVPLALLKAALTRVRVGADGIVIQDAFSPHRFVPYENIASTSGSEEQLTLVLQSRESIHFAAGAVESLLSASVTGGSMMALLHQRVSRARHLSSERKASSRHLMNALARDGRTLEGWKQSVRATNEQRYRVPAAPTREMLESLVQDGSVAPDVRIGAAIALHADAGTRVRVATETSALPELGAAIEAALDGDDPALEKAIATLKLES